VRSEATSKVFNEFRNEFRMILSPVLWL
jgi:hypothetical protein